MLNRDSDIQINENSQHNIYNLDSCSDFGNPFLSWDLCELVAANKHLCNDSWDPWCGSGDNCGDLCPKTCNKCPSHDKRPHSHIYHSKPANPQNSYIYHSKPAKPQNSYHHVSSYKPKRPFDSHGSKVI